MTRPAPGRRATADRSRQSLLHLQMGQEIIYLLLTVALVAAFLLLLRLRAPAPVVAAGAGLAAGITAVKGPVLEPPAPVAAGGPHAADLPPIIMLSEAQGYFFALGSAEIGREFRARLVGEVVPRIVELGRRYQVDVIEVIGHTDEIPLRLASRSNLDFALLGFLNGAAGGEELHAADNVGLGMGRAAAVSRALLQDRRLAGYTILPFSAGQAIGLDQALASGRAVADEQMRRRIEIRMRRRQ